MTGPTDDLPPPPVPPAPDFDAPVPFETPRSTGGSASGPGAIVSVVAVVVAAAILAALVLSRLSGPSPTEEVEALAVPSPATTAEPEPLAAVPLVEETIGELAPPPNVTVARPPNVPESAEVIEVVGRQAAGTVSRPDGVWLRATLEPGVYTFRVAAGADTELHLSDVFNELTFNDDADGLNPVITERLIGGDYYLWLHIHDEAVDATTAFTLAIDGP